MPDPLTYREAVRKYRAFGDASLDDHQKKIKMRIAARGVRPFLSTRQETSQTKVLTQRRHYQGDLNFEKTNFSLDASFQGNEPHFFSVDVRSENPAQKHVRKCVKNARNSNLAVSGLPKLQSPKEQGAGLGEVPVKSSRQAVKKNKDF